MFLKQFGVLVICCLASCGGSGGDPATGGDPGTQGQKGDSSELTEVEWANQHFMTQVMDPVWNPGGVVEDAASNNCGPASLAMLLSSRGEVSSSVEPEVLIDHARALMHPGYPNLDIRNLPEGAVLVESEGLVLVDDDAHPVYFDWVADDASVPEGIMNGGGEPVTGYSSAEMNALLDAHGAVIAHGHVTPEWVARFSGEYADVQSGSVPHFILIHRAVIVGEYIVCDPLHRGGAERMTSSGLQAFFTSPINAFETSHRLIAWKGEAARAPDAQRGPDSADPQ